MHICTSPWQGLYRTGLLAYLHLIPRTGQFGPVSVAEARVGDQFQQVWFVTQTAVQFLWHAIQYVHLHPGIPAQNGVQNPEHAGSLQIATWLHPQGSPQTFGHVGLYGHPNAKRSALPLPIPVIGIRGLVSGDRVLVRQDFSDPNHSPSDGLVVLPCSAAGGLIEYLRDRDHCLYRCLQPQSHRWGHSWAPISCKGHWSGQQASHHINLLEMEAVLLSVTGFLPQLKSRVVCLICNNAVVVSYIIKEGDTKSFRLTCPTICLLKFCDQKDIRLMPVHLPGSHNI